jgi:hypothetical protein
MKSIIDINADEFNDDPTRGNPRLYREITPDYGQVHREGQKAFKELARKYLNTKS